MSGDEIREEFLRFFEERGHKIIPSSSLVPHDDPTLLLTNAGMVQIKPYFLGELSAPSPRLASCQKCFRTSDINCVGDPQHLTFFEMLGNFSVGDYFKKEAIEWGWEFVTQRLKLLPERLWVTIFLDDDDAFHYWRRIGIPEDRILRFGEEDNFWGPAGDSGPCGPCSEIHYDFGEKFGCGKPTCKPGCDCGRFTEIWNLVFTEYNQDKEGKRTPLPRPNIDTGMGLERTAAVMQGKRSVYETDLFAPIVESVSRLAGYEHGLDGASKHAVRVVAEHARAITFIIGDGVVPANEGRGYVLRRVLRRASLFGRKLGLTEPFLTRVAESAIGHMGHVYPELERNREFILQVIESEEERFGQTLDIGLGWLDRLMDEVGGGRIPSREVFRLYDTYGFPPELTAEVAAERGFVIDLEGFEKEMENQRERARQAQKFTSARRARAKQYQGLGDTQFVGYDKLKHDSQIVSLLVGGEVVEVASSGDEVELILLETPFYGEMGGQVGDSGEIRGNRGKAVVFDSVRPLPELIVHCGRVIEGWLSLNDVVRAEVDGERRLDIARNHTATHLLHAALRQVLGSQVEQRGSLVAPERLRFDFSHLGAISEDEFLEVEHLVNEKIRQNLAMVSEVLPYTQALERGTIALFGEKYGNMVRVVQIGDPPFSLELCGGTHVRSTGELGFFHIISESGIGAGLRRIEALTGRGCQTFFENRLLTLESIARKLEATPDEAEEKLSTLIAELERERKRSLNLERQLFRKMADSLMDQAELVGEVRVLLAEIPASDMQMMREMGDLLKERLRSCVVVLGAVYQDRPNFLVMVSPDLVAKGIHAGQIAKQVAQVAGGGGGGKAEMGQAGGKDKEKLSQALSLARKLVRVN